MPLIRRALSSSGHRVFLGRIVFAYFRRNRMLTCCSCTYIHDIIYLRILCVLIILYEVIRLQRPTTTTKGKKGVPSSAQQIDRRRRRAFRTAETFKGPHTRGPRNRRRPRRRPVKAKCTCGMYTGTPW